MQRRRTESFLLRIVVQGGDSVPAENWRGRVQHIGTGVECAFAGLDELLALLAEHLAPLGDEELLEQSDAQPPRLISS
jgi:hypothetical protein